MQNSSDQLVVSKDESSNIDSLFIQTVEVGWDGVRHFLKVAQSHHHSLHILIFDKLQKVYLSSEEGHERTELQ